MRLPLFQLIQLGVTLIYTLTTSSPFAFIACILSSLLVSRATIPFTTYNPSTIVSITLITTVFSNLSLRVYSNIISTSTISYQNLKEVLAITLLAIIIGVKKYIVNKEVTLGKQAITMIYLVLVCVIPLQASSFQQSVGVGILITMCWVLRNNSRKVYRYFVEVVKWGLVVELLGVYCKRIGVLEWETVFLMKPQYEEISIFCCVGVIVSGDMLLACSQREFFEGNNTDPQGSYQPPIETEMQQLPPYRVTEVINPTSTLQLHQPSEPSATTEPMLNYQIQQDTVDTEPYNIIFLIPYFLLPLTIYEIPIYIYFFYLQFRTPTPLMRGILYISLNAILFLSYQPSFKLFLVSASMTCVMNWKISLEGGLSSFKALWLRWCFIIVLALLFWFALRKVNIFHMVLTIILLLFVTQGSQQGQRSFRNRNWKYLMLFFNSFLILRYLYSLLISKDIQLFQLLGVSFNYNENYLISQNFNFMPLLMSIVMTLQYWTYSNKIYKTESKQIVGEFVRNYKIFVKRLVTVITIIYYKTLIWWAYIITIGLVLIETFSVSSGLILIWTLLMFLIQVSKGSKTLLHKMWRIMSVILSVLIMTRYFFQFTKFPTIYKLFSKIPMFQFLYTYQHLLGLAVDNPAQNYFHTITKFQLMIALDFIQLLLTYLVVDYYNIINKYHRREELEQEQYDKVADIYIKYIDYKLDDLQQRMTRVVRGISMIYMKLFYVIVGLYTAISPTISQLLIILIVLVKYYKLNSELYRLVAGTRILKTVRDRFRQWFDYCSGRKERNYEEKSEELFDPNVIKGEIDGVRGEVSKCEADLHTRMRPYFTFVIMTFIILQYSSRVLYEEKTKDFISQDTLLEWKWYFYIFGTSISRKEWALSTVAYIIFLTMIILQYKSCQFISFFSPSDHIQSSHSPSLTVITNISSQQLMEKSIKVNMLLGIHKLIQRSYVTILIFISNMRSTPSSIFYLLMAFILNTFGTSSILALSKIQALITYLQYCLIVFNFENSYIYPHIPEEFKELAIESNAFGGLSPEWMDYWTFGKNSLEMGMFVIGIIVIASYQLYFRTMVWTSNKILNIMSAKEHKLVGVKIFNTLKNIYTYTIVLCPLLISLTAIMIYIIDQNLTNILLLTVTGIFVFKEYIAQQLASTERTRTFWKAYFRLFQILILTIMVLQCLLAIPEYNKYCIPLLCNQNKNLGNKIFESSLVLVFQLGIDILKSKEFERETEEWRKKFDERAELLRLIMANYHNDLKLDVLKVDFMKRRKLKENLKELLGFLEKLKLDKNLKYEDRCHIIPPKESLITIFLQYMPSLMDPPIMWDRHTAIEYLREQNRVMIKLYSITKTQFKELDDYYQRQFTLKYSDIDDLLEVINEKRMRIFANQSLKHSQENLGNYLPSPTNIMPDYNTLLQGMIRKTIVESHPDMNQLDEIEYQEKKKMIEYVLISAIISNWQYIAFVLMVFQHLMSNSVFTFFYPLMVFVFAIVQQYQTDKLVWIFTFVYTLGFVLLKYAIGLSLVKMDKDISLLLVGGNQGSFVIQFLLLIVLPIQVLLLQSIGLYKESIDQVESMKTCLIRNLLKIPPSQQQWKQQLQTLLAQLSETQSYGVFQNIFGRSQLKTGIDYSFLLTTIQLICLIYSFIFYEKMFIKNDLAFYSMIQYNQFNGGMVVWMLIQLLLMLIDRFLSILSFHNKDWEISLIIKHAVLIASIFLLNYMFLFQTPEGGNTYIFIFGFIYSFYFLLSALQVRHGINRISRGFMERYTWYNGFIYMGFRAVPFVFEFKVFSDWFVTRTVMRLFDWIKFEDLFGRLFVAKCNALFLQGKVMGNNIEWWKKVLMGLPLLMIIIILLFGPLVLFSTLNPLAQANPIIGGSVYISLSINNSNIYPLYVNSHISKISTPELSDLTKNIQDVIENYNIEEQCIQKVNLESYSDSYWEISEGSQEKLLEEPQESIYELIMTLKFTRKFTSTTPIYTLSTYIIPYDDIPQFKKTLAGQQAFLIPGMYNNALRLDNNNGLHVLTSSQTDVLMYAEVGKRLQKKYWMIQNGLEFIIVSDKYSEAIFGYSVVGFYISIILVVANYFRFIFQGSATTLWLTDIPVADPILTICEGIYLSRIEKDLHEQDFLYWTLIDLVRSPDTVKLLTGNYLDARKETLRGREEQMSIGSPPPPRFHEPGFQMLMENRQQEIALLPLDSQDHLPEKEQSKSQEYEIIVNRDHILPPS